MRWSFPRMYFSMRPAATSEWERLESSSMVYSSSLISFSLVCGMVNVCLLLPHWWGSGIPVRARTWHLHSHTHVCLCMSVRVVHVLHCSSLLVWRSTETLVCCLCFVPCCWLSLHRAAVFVCVCMWMNEKYCVLFWLWPVVFCVYTLTFSTFSLLCSSHHI